MSGTRVADLGTVIERTLAGLWRARRAVLVWCAILILLSGVSLAAMRPVLVAQVAMMRGGTMPLDGIALARFAILMVLMTALMLVLTVGTMRSVLDPAAARAAYLRIGADELRVLAVMLLVGLGGYVGMIVLIVAVIMVAVLLAGSTGTGGAIGVAGAVLAVGLSVYGLVRLSLAVPLTLRRGAISVRPAWRLSKGRFWYLVGGYLLTALMTMVAMASTFAMQMGDLSATFAAGSDPEASVRAMATLLDAQLARPLVWTLAIVMVTGIGNGLALAVQGGMAAQLLLAVDADEPDDKAAAGA